MSDRIREITNAVDDMLNRITKWCEDQAGPQVMPEQVVLSIQLASQIARSGDLPQCCQQLTTACHQLLVELERYQIQEHGAFRPENGSPGPQFWNAVKKVTEKRKGAIAPQFTKREPVSLLKMQGVTDDQIAFHVYGNSRGEGPFITENGQADSEAIAREAAEPGSVIPKGWIAPWELRAAEAKKKELMTQLGAFDHLETGNRYEDPETAEQMLESGCYIQQVMYGKNMTRAEVLKIAKEAGLQALDRPGAKIDDDVDPVLDDEQENQQAEERTRNISTKRAFQEDGVREAVLAVWEESGRQMGGAEISKQLKESGHDCVASRAGQFINAQLQRERKEAAKKELESAQQGEPVAS